MAGYTVVSNVSASKVEVGLMAEAITRELERYVDGIDEKIVKAVEDIAKEAKQEVQKRAPKATGRYQKSWRIKRVTSGHGRYVVKLHSKDRYQLTHLLEYGHIVHKKTGDDKTDPIPHLEPVEKETAEKLEKAIKDIFQWAE